MPKIWAALPLRGADPHCQLNSRVLKQQCIAQWSLLWRKHNICVIFFLCKAGIGCLPFVELLNCHRLRCWSFWFNLFFLLESSSAAQVVCLSSGRCNWSIVLVHSHVSRLEWWTFWTRSLSLILLLWRNSWSVRFSDKCKLSTGLVIFFFADFGTTFFFLSRV